METTFYDRMKQEEGSWISDRDTSYMGFVITYANEALWSCLCATLSFRWSIPAVVVRGLFSIVLICVVTIAIHWSPIPELSHHKTQGTVPLSLYAFIVTLLKNESLQSAIAIDGMVSYRSITWKFWVQTSTSCRQRVLSSNYKPTHSYFRQHY